MLVLFVTGNFDVQRCEYHLAERRTQHI